MNTQNWNSTLKMKASHSAETLVPVYQHTRRHISEDCIVLICNALGSWYWRSNEIFEIPSLTPSTHTQHQFHITNPKELLCYYFKIAVLKYVVKVLHRLKSQSEYFSKLLDSKLDYITRWRVLIGDDKYYVVCKISALGKPQRCTKGLYSCRVELEACLLCVGSSQIPWNAEVL
jgi:hypothetical protein